MNKLIGNNSMTITMLPSWTLLSSLGLDICIAGLAVCIGLFASYAYYTRYAHLTFLVFLPLVFYPSVVFFPVLNAIGTPAFIHNTIWFVITKTLYFAPIPAFIFLLIPLRRSFLESIRVFNADTFAIITTDRLRYAPLAALITFAFLISDTAFATALEMPSFSQRIYDLFLNSHIHILTAVLAYLPIIALGAAVMYTLPRLSFNLQRRLNQLHWLYALPACILAVLYVGSLVLFFWQLSPATVITTFVEEGMTILAFTAYMLAIALLVAIVGLTLQYRYGNTRPLQMIQVLLLLLPSALIGIGVLYSIGSGIVPLTLALILTYLPIAYLYFSSFTTETIVAFTSSPTAIMHICAKPVATATMFLYIILANDIFLFTLLAPFSSLAMRTEALRHAGYQELALAYALLQLLFASVVYTLIQKKVVT